MNGKIKDFGFGIGYKILNVSNILIDSLINLVFEPEWDKDMMSEEAKLELGFL